MARWIVFKEALAALGNWRLWLLHGFGNAAIFLSFLWWLRISEAHWWNLMFSLVLIIATAAIALVLHGGTLNYFAQAHREGSASIRPPFSLALRHLPAIVVWVFVFHLLEHAVGGLGHYQQTLPGYLRSEFPAWLRRTVSESSLDRTYGTLVFVVRWIVAPGLLLPAAWSAAGKGFPGLISVGDWRRAAGKLIYWIALIIASVAGVICVGEVMTWRLNPETSTLGGEEISFVLRLFAAGLLAVFAWFLTCSMLGRLCGFGQSGAQPE